MPPKKKKKPTARDDRNELRKKENSKRQSVQDKTENEAAVLAKYQRTGKIPDTASDQKYLRKALAVNELKTWQAEHKEGNSPIMEPSQSEGSRSQKRYEKQQSMALHEE